ncbi:MAG: porin family protein [Gemmatimonadota bacterium]
MAWLLRSRACAILLVLLALLVLPSTSAAQGFRGGVRADLALSDFRGADFDQDRRVGFRAGLWGELDLSGPVDILAEVVYATKGPDIDGGSFDPHFDYIEIPVAAKVGLGNSPVYLLAGPSISFRISDPYDDSEGDASEFLNTVDFGLLGGVGIDFALGSLPAMVDVRYHTGLSVIFDFDEDDDDRNSRNQVISVGMGVALF